MPMMNFTQDESEPSQLTLEIIRQIAYTYRAMVADDGTVVTYSIN